MKIIITGAAGFIGYHLTKRLLDEKIAVIGIDNINSYYDIGLKKARLDQLNKTSFKKKVTFKFYQEDINNQSKINDIFEKNIPDIVINLAAQAGVRYSIENPSAYIQTNLVGFSNILESCRNYGTKYFIYASSSSVYGGNTKMPFSEEQGVDHPISLYAATKRSNELIAHSYSHLYSIPSIGLRFFTVYGPWGRPDMALFKFTKAILEEKPIDIFNFGNHTRDFTYIDDIVEGIIKTIDSPSTGNNNWNSIKPDPATSKAPWCIYNIGNNKPVKLMDYVKALEKALGKKAKINFLPLQPGDVPDTYANVDNLKKKFNYKPATSVIEGVSNFVKWYKEFYQK